MKLMSTLMSPEQRLARETLTNYARRLRPIIARFGLDGFDLEADPTQALREILYMEVRPRQKPKDLRHAFVAETITLIPTTWFREDANEIQRIVQRNYEAGKERGGLGGITIMIVDVGNSICQIFPVAFGGVLAGGSREKYWMNIVAWCINEGRIA